MAAVADPLGVYWIRKGGVSSNIADLSKALDVFVDHQGGAGQRGAGRGEGHVDLGDLELRGRPFRHHVVVRQLAAALHRLHDARPRGLGDAEESADERVVDGGDAEPALRAELP